MLKIIVMLSFILSLCSTATALETHYDNQTGYNNKIPYSAFFNGHSPEPAKIAVQKGKVQAVVPVNTKEETPEQQNLKTETEGIKE